MTEFTQPTLHPERIRAAIRQLRAMADPTQEETRELGQWTEALQTAVAALELVRKGQLAVGLTGDVADAGQAALRLLATIQRLGK